MIKTHSFHIPVLGIGFTIDTPLKVSQFGIDSVISLGDDILLEKLRKKYCEKLNIPYEEITDKDQDYRAKRITAYLNLINSLARKKFEDLKKAAIEKGEEFKEYLKLLPDTSTLKQEFNNLTSKSFKLKDIKEWAKNNLTMGSIDVNIMTKLDKENYIKKEKLPVEYNDAHAAIRGFANSDLSSSVVLSAGLNPRLYGYMEQFQDFFPDKNGVIKKKIVLKVSDYRSAMIQGKFLAKKGLWVSEYRIESGLNCGGHAFATDGFLMGPILAEFKNNRTELISSIHQVLIAALESKNRTIPRTELALKITTQGGVGTAAEHQFLLDHYQVDSVGWGTPFLLVPEATVMDEPTLQKLIDAKEEDLYLSNISPLGVPFNSLRGNTKDIEKEARIAKGKPGSPCVKKFLISNNEFTEKSICTASRQYQSLKIKELDKAGLPKEEYQNKYAKIVEKACLCSGLGESALIVNEISNKETDNGVAICPGPNMAYFSKKMSLTEIIDHIYGRANMISRTDRPNMFVKELNIYIDYLKNKVSETSDSLTEKQKKYFQLFSNNLNEGINYYHQLFTELMENYKDSSSSVYSSLNESRGNLGLLNIEINNLITAK